MSEQKPSSQPKPHASVRSALFKQVTTFLEQEQIRYCVVGDTRQLPEQIDGDVDFMVDQEEIDAVPGRLSAFCRTRDLYLAQVIQHESTAYFCVIAAQDTRGRFHFLQADICGDYYRDGKRFLSAEELLDHRVMARNEAGQKKGFYVPTPAQEFTYYLLKKVEKQQITDEQGRHLSRQWNWEPDRSRRNIARFWPPRFQSVISHAAEQDNWITIRQLLPDLKKVLHNNWSASLRERREEVRRLVKRISEPAGLFLSVMGPDGSGKSSICRHLLEDVAPAFWDTEYVHLRPKLGCSRSDGDQPAVTDPHGKPVRGQLPSIVKNLYYLADYNLGHLLDIKPRLIRSNLVVFDRYFHDILVDPRRYRYGGPSTVIQWSSNLLPQPELFIFLDAPAPVLQQRKQEVSHEETRRQRREYRKLADRLENSCIVDASKPLEQVVADVERHVLQYMTKRTADRVDAEVSIK